MSGVNRDDQTGEYSFLHWQDLRAGYFSRGNLLGPQVGGGLRRGPGEEGQYMSAGPFLHRQGRHRLSQLEDDSRNRRRMLPCAPAGNWSQIDRNAEGSADQSSILKIQ